MSYVALAHSMWVDDYDLTGDLTVMGLGITFDPLDDTRFSTTLAARMRKGGLHEVTASADGWQSYGVGAADPDLFAGLGTGQLVITQSPTGAAGSVAYFHQATKFSLQQFGKVGELVPFSVAAQAAGSNGAIGAVRGQVAAARGNVSATGQVGSVLNLGAPGASDYVYCVVHIFSVGTTITLQLQSDDNAGMSSPTTRATIGPLTTAGATWMSRLAGPFTGETHWRLNCSAVTGTHNLAAAIAVQNVQ